MKAVFSCLIILIPKSDQSNEEIYWNSNDYPASLLM